EELLFKRALVDMRMHADRSSIDDDIGADRVFRDPVDRTDIEVFGKLFGLREASACHVDIGASLGKSPTESACNSARSENQNPFAFKRLIGIRFVLHAALQALNRCIAIGV